MTIVYLALGSNIGDRKKNIQEAIGQLTTSGIRILKTATPVETDPFGGPPQARFLNTVLQAETTLSPRNLLKKIQTIENTMGRIRQERNGPRNIDIDILFYGDRKIVIPGLIIPHPRMPGRDFVLKPLKEIAPDLAEAVACKS